MPRVWIIEGWDSGDKFFETELLSISESEIETVLKRLACRHLSDIEIVDSSRRANDTKRLSFLDRIGRGKPITVGENPYYTAVSREK